MVDLGNELDDDVGNAINFSLLAHKINLVMQSFGNLENRMDEEAITQLFRLGAVESKHFLAKLLLHALREVVKQTE